MPIRPLAVLAALITVAAPAVLASQHVPTTDVLARAGAWVASFAADATFVVAEEAYEQEYRRRAGSEWQTERRALRSEIILVRTPPEEAGRGFPWVQFRDVQEVDGRPLADHQGRLQRLFHDPSGAAYARARELVEESARYNIGPAVRTINVPAFALFFLVTRNQERFRFRLQGEDTVDGMKTVVLRYEERDRPTMIRSPRHEDRPARGTFWIDAATGRVVKTLIEVDGERRWRTEIEVDYARDARLDLWVPATMRERHARGDREALVCTATYSNYQRFETTARMVPR